MGACCANEELVAPTGEKIKDLPVPSLIGLDVY